MVSVVTLSASVHAGQKFKTHFKGKQIGIAGRRCERADALCELVEVVLGYRD